MKVDIIQRFSEMSEEDKTLLLKALAKLWLEVACQNPCPVCHVDGLPHDNCPVEWVERLCGEILISLTPNTTDEELKAIAQDPDAAFAILALIRDEVKEGTRIAPATVQGAYKS